MSSDQYAVIDSVLSSENEGFLATIIDVEGSAYRKEGTMMYISHNRIEAGLLSGGCLEEDILSRINNLDDKKAFLMNYDLRSEDDLGWGQGIGCDGSITILIECITDELVQFFDRIKEQLKIGNRVDHKKCINKELGKIDSWFLIESGICLGKTEIEVQLNELDDKSSFWDLENNFIFKQSLLPAPRLIIYGAGPDVVPVVSYANDAGFYVILSDWREFYCNSEKIPFAKEYIIGHPTEVMKKIQPTTGDFCLIMTHSFMKDQELVNYFLERKLTYLGILGSKKRTEKLLDKFKLPDWVYYPVGMQISSESPAEIAISIVAELILVKNSLDRSSI